MPDTNSLEELLGYRFKDPKMLDSALIHSSAHDVKGITQGDIEHVERLSWLGDSVLDLAVSHELYSTLKTAPKARLNQCYEDIVNNDAVGRMAKQLGFDAKMIIGKSLQQNPEAKDKHVMLAGALEAVLGAIYLDGGIQGARAAVRKLWAEDFRKCSNTSEI